MRRSVLLALCTLGLVLGTAPASLFAQGSGPFSPPPPPQPSLPSTEPTAPAGSSSRGGIGTGAQVGLFVVGALLLAGIATVIVRDARRSARAAGPERRPKSPSPPVKPTPSAPGARGRPTGKGGAARRRRSRRR